MSSTLLTLRARTSRDNGRDNSVEQLAMRIAAELRDTLGLLRLSSRACGAKTQPLGFHVVVEGIDGAGVTSISQILAAVLSHLVVGAPVVYAKEPSGSPIGSMLRWWLRGWLRLEPPEAIAHLFAADRLAHLYDYPVAPGARGVIGALAAGYIVVQDRYKYSSAAYQSVLGHSAYTPREILALNSAAPPPHILVYLDVEPEVALERIRRSRGVFEKPEDPDILGEVRRAYREIIEALRGSPEWPAAGEEPAWSRLLRRATGLEPECLYPPTTSYPIIIELDANQKLEEVARQAADSVIQRALSAALLERVQP